MLCLRDARFRWSFRTTTGYLLSTLRVGDCGRAGDRSATGGQAAANWRAHGLRRPSLRDSGSICAGIETWPGSYKILGASWHGENMTRAFSPRFVFRFDIPGATLKRFPRLG